MGPKSRWGGVGWSGWLSQTSPIPRSPDGDNKVFRPVRAVFSNQLKLFTFDLNNGSFYHIQHPPPPSSTTPPLPPSTAAYIQQMKGDDE